MKRIWTARVSVAGVAVVLGCSGRPPLSTDDPPPINTDLAVAGSCDGAVLEYHDVCFHPHSVEAMGYEHPLDLDGEPGHELVGVDDGKVSVHKWNGDGFVLLGEADMPGKVDSSLNAGVVAGEFDDVPGLDLVVAQGGEWVALYHLTESGAPEFVSATIMSVSGGHGFARPIAVGPDDDGRWRVIAYVDHDGFISSDHVALWEMQGATFVGERLDLPSKMCSFAHCAGGDFNGDGRRDAVCTLMDYCSDPSPDEDVAHIVFLAQGDGSVSSAAYPSVRPGGLLAADINDDGFTDLLSPDMVRLGDGAGGLSAAITNLDLPPPFHYRWNVVSVGDIDNDGNTDIVLGERGHGLVYHDRVSEPEAFQSLTLDGGYEFGSYSRYVIDVNGDGIIDLPVRDRSLLVSEVGP